MIQVEFEIIIKIENQNMSYADKMCSSTIIDFFLTWI